LARPIADAFAASIPNRACQVRLSDTGALQWVEEINGKEIVYDHDPHTAFWRRAAVFVTSLLAIEWLL
jgi:putative cardiolipin synthase